MNIFGILKKSFLQGSGTADATSQPSIVSSIMHPPEPTQATGEPQSAPTISERPADGTPAAPFPAVLPGAGKAFRNAETSNQPSVPQEATAPPAETSTPAMPLRRHLSHGLMDLPELRSFLDDNYFGLGRHNGINFRTADARERGVQALIAEFQNIMCSLSAQKQIQIDRLKDALLETEGVCDVTTKRLQMAVQKFESEAGVFREQLDLAGRRLGWVQQPLTKYELGFSQGIKMAMDAEHLGF